MLSITMCIKNNSCHNIFNLINKWKTKVTHPALRTLASYYVALDNSNNRRTWITKDIVEKDDLYKV